jgi:hypothetical protein
MREIANTNRAEVRATATPPMPKRALVAPSGDARAWILGSSPRMTTLLGPATRPSCHRRLTASGHPHSHCHPRHAPMSGVPIGPPRRSSSSGLTRGSIPIPPTLNHWGVRVLGSDPRVKPEDDTPSWASNRPSCDRRPTASAPLSALSSRDATRRAHRPPRSSSSSSGLTRGLTRGSIPKPANA